VADVDGDEVFSDTVGVNSNGGCVEGVEEVSGEWWVKMDCDVSMGVARIGSTSRLEWGFWRRRSGRLEVFEC